jgi:hypothetical protein
MKKRLETFMAATNSLGHLRLATVLVITLLLSSPPMVWAESAKPQPKKGTGQTAGIGGDLQRRIDFGNAYILGQSIKSGAVYLLHRKKSDIKSMLHYRENYRDEILESFSVVPDNELGQGNDVDLDVVSIEPKEKKTVSK